MAACNANSIVGFLACNYLFVPPRYHFILNPVVFAGLAGYSISCALIIYTGELMHRARERAEREVTERKRVVEALHESENLFRTLVNASSQSVWRLRPNGGPAIRGIDDGNAAWWREFTGQTEEQRTADDGMGWLAAVHEEDLVAARKNWLKIVSTDEPTAVEFRALRADGAWRWLFVQGVPIKDERAKVIEWAGTVRDITERKEAEREREELLKREHEAREIAEKANSFKDEFLATLSHELRNPLNVILGYSELLLRTPEVAKSRHLLRMGEALKRNAQSQSQLINDLLDLSRL
ncbi:MAG TPA: histidine kinase dimerization/phospho-acceptor domain-containing protein, partial [Pyrinomonadaceae bacterium]